MRPLIILLNYEHILLKAFPISIWSGYIQFLPRFEIPIGLMKPLQQEQARARATVWEEKISKLPEGSRAPTCCLHGVEKRLS
ncbi:unnamed protein product [Pieris brassicae]|uniref:Uncharacterized protein n=1 Tax=Pieris brassicae TaxID=7116 RepID=A0A9P0XIC7_PIEBR|nr:unnamed protein product [Pieris brassicae]